MRLDKKFMLCYSSIVSKLNTTNNYIKGEQQMANINVRIKDKNGNYIYPETKGSLVVNNSGDSLGGVQANAEVNTINSIKLNNSALTPDANKAVNISVPEYTVIEQATPDTGFYATYYLAKDNIQSGSKIQIPNSGGNVPSATDTTEGIMKLYNTVGENTDGTMTQSAIKAYVEQAIATAIANLVVETSETMTIDVDTGNGDVSS